MSENTSLKTDFLIVGSGPSGMMAGITAAKKGIRVKILEQMPKPGLKLLATGGRRCNLTNTLSPEQIMADFGRTGRFMSPAMKILNNSQLREFFHQLGVETHSPDGFRVWPKTHKSTSIHSALLKRAEELGVQFACDCKVEKVLVENGVATGVMTQKGIFKASAVLLSTGGLSLSSTGATGSGYIIAKEVGHKVKPTYPSGVPLFAREEWTGSCTSETIPKVRAKVSVKRSEAYNNGKPMKGIKNIRAVGDLIFTRKGIAGPLALNLSREIMPLLDRYAEIPVDLNLVHGHSEASLLEAMVKQKTEQPQTTLTDGIAKFVPLTFRNVLFEKLELNPSEILARTSQKDLTRIADYLVKCPLTIYDSAGYIRAIATKGGVDLKEISPDSLMSKSIKNLFFSGELVDLDGPCGGYNLTWAFTSGHLAGYSAARFLS